MSQGRVNAEGGKGPLGLGSLVGSRNVLVQDRRPDLSRAGLALTKKSEPRPPSPCSPLGEKFQIKNSGEIGQPPLKK